LNFLCSSYIKSQETLHLSYQKKMCQVLFLRNPLNKWFTEELITYKFSLIYNFIYLYISYTQHQMFNHFCFDLNQIRVVLQSIQCCILEQYYFPFFSDVSTHIEYECTYNKNVKKKIYIYIYYRLFEWVLRVSQCNLMQTNQFV